MKTPLITPEQAIKLLNEIPSPSKYSGFITAAARFEYVMMLLEGIEIEEDPLYDHGNGD